jgi:PilZ domain
MPVHGNGGGPPFEGTVTVIGLGGMFIRTAKAKPPGTVINLTLEDPVAAFDSECTVRNVADNGMGVEITKISAENEQRLRFLLIRLKGSDGG